jgi:hypothetical protein
MRHFVMAERNGRAKRFEDIRKKTDNARIAAATLVRALQAWKIHNFEKVLHDPDLQVGLTPGGIGTRFPFIGHGKHSSSKSTSTFTSSIISYLRLLRSWHQKPHVFLPRR